jgi:hypothetical protein
MHKKTIKKKGKEFGPYFYTTVRTKKGKIKTHYLGTDEETAKKREKKILLSYRQKKHPIGTSKIKTPSKKILAPAVLIIIVLIASAYFLTFPPKIPVITEIPVVEIKTQSGITGESEITQTPSGNFNLEISSVPVEPAKPETRPQVEIKEIRNPPGKIESKIDTYTGPQPSQGRINTQILAVKQELEFDEALVTLPKTGPVNTIVYCSDFDFEDFTCPAWERTKIPFQETADTISFRVTRFSAYGGAIINITKADHLDENRTFISSIFEDVRYKDGIWSEPIYHNEYVRITFEQELDNTKDITVYVRNTQQLNTKIKVYYYNSNEKITEYPIITEEKYYKVYLTGMQGSHDVFDLKIINLDNITEAYLEFDHIIDPVINITEEQVVTDSLLTNIIAETGKANFTHLSIDDSDDVYLEFDGDGDYVDVGQPDSLDFGTGNLTITAWVKGNFNTTENMVIVNRGWGDLESQRGYQFYFYYEPTFWHHVPRFGIGDEENGSVTSLSNAKYFDGKNDQWFFVVAKREGDILNAVGNWKC